MMGGNGESFGRTIPDQDIWLRVEHRADMLTDGWAVSTPANVRVLAFIEMVGFLISKPFSLLMALTCHPETEQARLSL